MYEGIEGVFLVPEDAALPVELPAKNSDDIYAAGAGEKGTFGYHARQDGPSGYFLNVIPILIAGYKF